ncbi:hypothetical protein ACFL40_05025 [candidate division KSB1 bacterium]
MLTKLRILIGNLIKYIKKHLSNKMDKNRNNEDSQTKEELKVFDKFKKNMEKEISCSVISRDKIIGQDSYPDIYCELSDGTTTSFELTISANELSVELQKYKELIVKSFYNNIDKLNTIKKTKLINTFAKYRIFLHYNKKILSKSNRLNNIVSYLIEDLLIYKNVKSGEINVPKILKNKGIDKIIFENNPNKNKSEIQFECGSLLPIEDNVLKSIEKKFNKSYKFDTDYLELLIYFNLSRDFPVYESDLKVKGYIETNIKPSKFDRVWIYSYIDNKILFVYPEL